MKKIIITFDEGIEDIEATFAVTGVIKRGRISKSRNGQCYCFLTTFTNNTRCFAERTKNGTDTFRITK